MVERTNPLEPCTMDELRRGLDYARRKHKQQLHSGTLRAVFNRTQQRYEKGDSFAFTAREEARQLRIDRREFEALVEAVYEMGRARQGAAPNYLMRGPLRHDLVPANDRDIESNPSVLHHDMVYRTPQTSTPKPKQLDLL